MLLKQTSLQVYTEQRKQLAHSLCFCPPLIFSLSPPKNHKDWTRKQSNHHPATFFLQLRAFLAAWKCQLLCPLPDFSFHPSVLGNHLPQMGEATPGNQREWKEVRFKEPGFTLSFSKTALKCSNSAQCAIHSQSNTVHTSI